MAETVAWHAGDMRIARIGFTPLKGARHATHAHVDLADSGPVGDRVFCLVDPARGRVLRTVENPSLMLATARWRDPVLTVQLGERTETGTPRNTGEVRDVDYWGRRASVELVDGPWASMFAEHLGYDVVLARSAHPGEVVYGGSVTLVTTASMRLVAEKLGGPVASEQFRSTFLVDTAGSDDEPHMEEGWVGRTLHLGAASVLVRGPVPRCAVVDVDPATGRRERPVLSTLAGYRRGSGEIDFGVDATVLVPGRVHDGDTVVLGRD